MLRKLIYRLNRYLIKKSFKAAEQRARKLAEEKGSVVWVFMWNGDFEAMTKKAFKRMWHDKPAMKKRTIAEWSKLVYEYRADRRQVNTAA